VDDDLKVDVVSSSTGDLYGKEKASAHLAGGRGKKVFSRRGREGCGMPTVVSASTTRPLKAYDTVISHGSGHYTCPPLVQRLSEDRSGVVPGS